MLKYIDVKRVRRCGGIGRHKGLKIPRGRLRTGSSPVIGTRRRLACMPQKNRRVAPVFFLRLIEPRRLCADDACSPKYGRSSRGRANAGRLLAIPSLASLAPYKPGHLLPAGGLLVCRKKTDGLRPSFFYVSLSLAASVPMTRAVRNMDARRGAGQTRAGSSLFRHSLRLLLTSPVICYPPAACLYAAKKQTGCARLFFTSHFL